MVRPLTEQPEYDWEGILAAFDVNLKAKGSTSIAFSSLNRDLRALLTKDFELDAFEQTLHASLGLSLNQLKIKTPCPISLGELWESPSIQEFWRKMQEIVTAFTDLGERDKRISLAGTCDELNFFVAESYEDAFFLGVRETLAGHLEVRNQENEAPVSPPPVPKWVAHVRTVAPGDSPGPRPRAKVVGNGGRRAQVRKDARAAAAITPLTSEERTLILARPIIADEAIVAESSKAELKGINRRFWIRIGAVLTLCAALAGGTCVCGGVGTGIALSCNPSDKELMAEKK